MYLSIIYKLNPIRELRKLKNKDLTVQNQNTEIGLDASVANQTCQSVSASHKSESRSENDSWFI